MKQSLIILGAFSRLQRAQSETFAKDKKAAWCPVFG